MQQEVAILAFDTPGRGLSEVTADIATWVRQTGIRTGVLTLFCRHTSAGLLITENASRAVHRDLLRWLAQTAPDGPDYEHDDEGPDDMPAHIRTLLTGHALTIPVADGAPMLGTWQGIFLAEHRHAPHRRTLAVHLVGN
jgi:secondary thiamine-phosphate synthase enzyme